MDQHRVSFKVEKVNKPPRDEPWVWWPRSLLTSPAWRAMSLHCRRLLDYLLIEHMAHAGRENGELLAPYDQLQAFGLGRRFIWLAIWEAEALGLIEVKRGGKRNVVENEYNRYRLTFYQAKETDQWRRTYYATPTNDWRRITPEMVKSILAERQQRRAQRSKSSVRYTDRAPAGSTSGEPDKCTMVIPSEGKPNGRSGGSRVHHECTAYNISGSMPAGPASRRAAKRSHPASAAERPEGDLRVLGDIVNDIVNPQRP